MDYKMEKNLIKKKIRLLFNLTLILFSMLASAEELTGRYLRIEAKGEMTSLSVAEVKVFSGDENKAIGKDTAASSTISGADSELSVDNDINTVWHSEEIANSWLEIDLGADMPISKVQIYNDPEKQESLNGSTLTIKNSNDSIVYNSENHTDIGTGIITHNFEMPATSLSECRTKLAPVFDQPAPLCSNGGYDKAYCMPIGSGLLSAMISYEEKVEIHLSRCDFFAIDDTDIGDWKSKFHSPGHISLDLGIERNEIQSFSQRLDYNSGAVVIDITTATGNIKINAFGKMDESAIIFEIEDTRSSRIASAQYSIWRPLNDPLNPIDLSSDTNIAKVKEVHKYIANGDAHSSNRTNPFGNVPDNDKYFNVGAGTDIAFASDTGIISSDIQITDSNINITPDELPVKYWLIVTCEVTSDGQPEVKADALMNNLLNTDKIVFIPANKLWWNNYWNKNAYIDLYGVSSDAPLKSWYSGMYTLAIVNNPDVPVNFNGSGLLVYEDRFSWGSALYWQNNRILMWMMGASGLHDKFKRFLKYYDFHFNDSKILAKTLNKLGTRLLEAPQMHKTGMPAKEKDVTAFDLNEFNTAVADFSWEANSNTLNASERSFQQAAEMVQQMFDYVAFTGDTEFRDNVAIPWLKEATLFYLTMIREDSDNKYHMMKTDAVETFKVVKDSIIDIAAMHYLFTMVLTYGNEFGYEQEFIDTVQERFQNLAPIPKGSWFVENNNDLTIDYTADQFGVANEAPRSPAEQKAYNAENPELYPVMPFAFADAQSDADLLTTALNTYQNRNFINIWGWDQGPLDAARLQLSETFDTIITHNNKFSVYPYGGFSNCAAYLNKQSDINKLTVTPQLDSMCIEMAALQEMLLQSHQNIKDTSVYAPGIGPIHIIPAVKNDMSGKFKLFARGGFKVECSFRANKEITYLKITSLNGGKLSLINPLTNCNVIQNGNVIMSNVTDKIINIDTQQGDDLLFSENLPEDLAEISGEITGDIISGVKISLSGPVNTETLTDTEGKFIFSNLIDGTYLVQPSSNGYSFSPSKRYITISTSSRTDAVFEASKTETNYYTLTVNRGIGSGIYPEGSTVNIVADTQNNGIFDLWSGDTEFIDNPATPSTTLTMPKDNVTITAQYLQGPLITGRIFTAGNDIGIEGVTVTAKYPDGTSTSTTTDANGEYFFKDLTVGEYTIWPDSDSQVFFPNNKIITIENTEIVKSDFCVYLPPTNKDDFVTLWDTSISSQEESDNNSIFIPFADNSPHDIDWDNDGIYDITGHTGEITHTFENPGIYIINIKASSMSLNFSNADDNKKLLAIIQWGTSKWSTMYNAFFNCENLIIPAKDTPDLSDCSNCSSMFYNAQKISIADGNWNWDTSNVTDMSNMFSTSYSNLELNPSLFNADISSWDVSNVTNMNSMFEEAKNFNADISNWNVSKVTDMSYMFSDAENFNQDLSSWNVSSVENMSGMLWGAKIFNANISSWNVSNVSDMSYMFSNTKEFNQDLSSWNVSNVWDMNNMFWNATKFNQDISSWDVSNVNYMDSMFELAISFNQNINDWDISNVESMWYMFSFALEFNSPLDKWNTSSVTDMSNIFNNAISFNQPIGNWDTSGVTNMSSIFENAISFNQSIENWDTSSVIDMSNIFKNAYSYNNPLDSWDVSNVTDMSKMFYGACTFNQPLSSWNTEKVTNFSQMFAASSNSQKMAFNQSLASWNVSSLENAEEMFLNSSMSIENYDDLLLNWSSQTLNTEVIFNAGNSKFTPGADAEAARKKLIDDFNWVINDGGPGAMYELIVNNGQGSGEYIQGEKITITAAVPAGMIFNAWSGDTEYIEGQTESLSSITIPDHNITITAIFTPAPENTSSISGVIDGDIKEGITVYADKYHSTITDSQGAYTISGLTENKYNITPSINGYTFTPSLQEVDILNEDINNINFTSATDVPKYFLHVDNGIGTGYYAENQTVQITAATPWFGNVFSKWLGNTSVLDDPTKSQITFTMPAENIVLTAVYKTAPSDTYNISGIITGEIDKPIIVYADETHFGIANENGFYIITGLKNGDYTIHPRSENLEFLPNEKSITINDSDYDNVNFEIINNLQKYSLTVYDGYGSGIYNEDDQITISPRIPNGFSFEKWEGDTEILEDITSPEQLVTIPNYDVTLTAVLSTSYLSGQVIELDGKTGIPEIEIKIESENGYTINTLTDENGFYKFEQLADGQYSVNAVSENYHFLPSKQNLIFKNSNLKDINFQTYTEAVDSEAFVTVWNTLLSDSANDTISLFLIDGPYNIDWDSDGIYDETDVSNSITHTYDTPGIYTVSIKTTNSQITFDIQNDYAKILSILNWGNGKWQSMNDAFAYCNNLIIEAKDVPDLSECEDLYHMFYNSYKLGTGSGNWNWDTSNITNMNSMFENTSFNKDISSWDTSNVIDMNSMFASTLFNKDISSWNTSNVRDMSYMFYKNKVFNQPLNAWDVSNITSFYSMFEKAKSFNQPLDKWETTSATDFANMFNNAISFQQDISLWNIENLTDADDMFNGVTLSTHNYDALLSSWGKQKLHYDVYFNAGNSKYSPNSEAAEERSRMTDIFNWQINDGGTAELYTLTVNEAYGSGDYAESTLIKLIATPPENSIFESWDGDTSLLDNPDSPTAILTMPANNIEFTAVYQPMLENTYSISGIISDNNQYSIFMNLDGELITVSNTDGHFSLNGIEPGEHIITPSLKGYTFSPESITINIEDSNISDLTFKAISSMVKRNNPPIAVDDHYSIMEGEILTIAAQDGVLVNDSDQDGDTLTVNNNNSTLELNPDGSFTFDTNYYDPGKYIFQYEANDGTYNSNTANIRIDILPDTRVKTIAIDDSYSMQRDTVLKVNSTNGLLANDNEIENQTQTLILNKPKNGTVNLKPDGSFEYTPNSLFIGTDTFSYYIMNSDPQSEAEVKIKVTSSCFTLGSILKYNIDKIQTHFNIVFDKPPKLFGYLQNGKKTALKQVKNSLHSTLAGVWGKKISLNSKEAKQSGYTQYINLYGAATPLVVQIYANGKDSNKTKLSLLIEEAMLVPPVITYISTDEKPAFPGEEVILKGKYFGTKAPKIAINVDGKLIKCKINKGYMKYLDSKGKPSVMNPETGDSEMMFTIPTKHITSGIYPIILDNKIGIATTQKTNNKKATLPKITIN
jgi:surface protein